MSNYNSIAGCVTLYNPEEFVFTNILSYINSISLLIVVDNSERTNNDLVNRLLEYKNVQYINKNCNLGVATALNIAAKIALNNGFDWMLTMDQDSSLEPDFFTLSSSLLSNKENIIIAASYNNIFYNPQSSDYEGFIEIGTVITSGNLLNLPGWRSLGGFCDKLFIDEVDNEFCIRAIKDGYKILSTDMVYLSHNLGQNYFKINIKTQKILTFNKHAPFRLYYITRNNLFLWKKYLLVNPKLILNRVKNLIKLFFEITFYYPDKRLYYKFMAKGTFHFLISKYGRL